MTKVYLKERIITDKERIKSFFYRLIGYVYIPEQLKNNKQNILLHISDTPETFFPALKKLIKDLKPNYIVHTGDLVDNIKLELYPASLRRYEKKVKILLDILEESKANDIYLCIGNHDNKNAVERLAKRSKIIEDSKRISINNLGFTVSHFPEKVLKEPSKYNLLGHNLSVKNRKEYNQIYLNGIMSINIIDLNTERIFNLSYPFGTDEDRLGRGKIGF
ncbi:metallophosphoesterase family protein [Clostridium ganghwense]|uniref:Metallophosphoesterase family protein n=1 Tax=Clostridium ganghwense TaxID=312089 RepID=A0ABT4CSN1_9CLOT|nr:metallophosphoesterase family protein [Clostridium ganghwense]MCY6372081.1 metallophosphoesterase family protein [Clostridium ganghwense]